MNMKAILAAGAIALSASAASAATVTVLNQSTQLAGNTAHVYGVEYGAYVPPGASWTDGDPTITPPPGNSTNFFQSPFANTPLQETQSYFSVGGPNKIGGINTLAFDSIQNSFRILWGSIDNYNTLEFLFDGGVVKSYTGTAICALLSVCTGPVNAGNYNAVALLNFSGLEFDAVRFNSTVAAFEFALAPVPVPAAGLLLLGGLGGLAALKRRKKA
jgi:hypothetical protein